MAVPFHRLDQIGISLVPSGCQKLHRPASATTSSSRVAMLIRPISAPADDARGEQIK